MFSRSLANKHGCTIPLCQRVLFSTSPSRSAYKDTIPNLKIGAHTRVIFQGFTGRQATANAQESLAWGTQIVGGVTPGRDGMHPVLQELPVLPTVRAAMDQLKPDATGIYVAAHQAAAAIEEAIEAEIPLIVAVAEHIPVHDIMRVRFTPCSNLSLNPAFPLPTFAAGHVGIVAKSGTLSYETVASLTRAGLGQSLCIGMGGDIIAGTDFVDALTVFEHDADTHGIIIVGEVGGHAEEEAAEWIKEYRKRTSRPKPIAALVAGKLAKPGHVMGHSGAWAGRGENSAEQKYRILQDAGAVMVDHPAQFGQVMNELLISSTKARNPPPSAQRPNGRRSYHTAHRPRPTSPFPQQQRGLHFQSSQASDLILQHGISITRDATSEEESKACLVSVTIDRSGRGPCFLTCKPAPGGRNTSPIQAPEEYIKFPFDFREGPTPELLAQVLEHLPIDPTTSRTLTDARTLLLALHEIFTQYEGIAVEAKLAIAADTSALLVYAPRLTFDDAAFKSCGRHAALHAQRDVSPAAVDPSALAAEADGIVYVRLGPQDPADPEYTTYDIGTLVNGAGLAMNTVDALVLPRTARARRTSSTRAGRRPPRP
ncbi:Succinyl-synthetase alpha subunit [Mycena venus]|uniref:Succinyl-synthetase alpha subunit n=1 Tax=Mycena venus TaxID=2733690 RepID=A0A8H6YQN6_9AGAR|nr:Succinyl-synthetase alpha subunit [Mycena venus]